MAFWTDLGKGISSHVKAMEFIAKHKLWLNFLYPLAIAAALYIVGFFSFWALGSWIADHIIAWIGLDGDTDGWMGWLVSALSFLISGIVKLFFISVLATYLKYIVLIICSPILALLSERVDEIITGQTYPFDIRQFLKDIMRGILVVFRNMFIETGVMILCMFVTFIPLLGYLLTVLTVPTKYIFGCYFLGFSMMDYTYERRRWSISQGARFTRKHKGIAIGNGFVFQLLLLIPILGITLAPILSCVAATLAVLEAHDNDAKEEQRKKQQQWEYQQRMQQQYQQQQWSQPNYPPQNF